MGLAVSSDPSGLLGAASESDGGSTGYKAWARQVSRDRATSVCKWRPVSLSSRRSDPLGAARDPPPVSSSSCGHWASTRWTKARYRITKSSEELSDNRTSCRPSATRPVPGTIRTLSSSETVPSQLGMRVPKPGAVEPDRDPGSEIEGYIEDASRPRRRKETHQAHQGPSTHRNQGQGQGRKEQAPKGREGAHGTGDPKKMQKGSWRNGGTGGQFDVRARTARSAVGREDRLVAERSVRRSAAVDPRRLPTFRSASPLFSLYLHSPASLRGRAVHLRHLGVYTCVCPLSSRPSSYF